MSEFDSYLIFVTHTPIFSLESPPRYMRYTCIHGIVPRLPRPKAPKPQQQTRPGGPHSSRKSPLPLQDNSRKSCGICPSWDGVNLDPPGHESQVAYAVIPFEPSTPPVIMNSSLADRKSVSGHTSSALTTSLCTGMLRRIRLRAPGRRWEPAVYLCAETRSWSELPDRSSGITQSQGRDLVGFQLR